MLPALQHARKSLQKEALSLFSTKVETVKEVVQCIRLNDLVDNVGAVKKVRESIG